MEQDKITKAKERCLPQQTMSSGHGQDRGYRVYTYIATIEHPNSQPWDFTRF
jgi:hypothetical protein